MERATAGSKPTGRADRGEMGTASIEIGLQFGCREMHVTHERIHHLVAEHGAALVLYARQWCVMPDDALQDALCDLSQAAEEPRDVAAWLFKVVRHKAMNLARSERRRRGHQQRAASQRDDWFLSRHETQVEARELEGMLSSLPELEREIVVARIWGELSFQQISELTDKPTSTVHRHYVQALARLRRALDGGGNEPSTNLRSTSSDPLELNP